MNISIHNKQNKIDALKLDGVYDELLYSIEKYQDTVNKQEEILRTCGLEGVTDISTEEYVMIFTKLKQYRDIVFKIYDVNQDIIDKAIEYATTYGYVHDDIIALENSISNSQSVIDNLNSEITKYTMMLESIKILDQRPAECSIDTCPFIAKALEDSKEEPEKWIKTCYADITSATASIHDKKQKLEELKEVAQVVDSIEFIIKDALDNYDILSKFKESHMFCYREDLVTRLSNHNSFNEVEDCDKYIQLADSINGYRNNKNILKDLLAQKTVYDSKIELMDELTNEIDELYTKLTGAETKINEYYDSIEFNSGLVRTQEDRVIKFNELRDYLLSRDNRLAQKEDLKIQFSKIRDDIAEIKDSVDRLNRKRHEMDQANAEIKPLKESRDQLVYSIKRAEEYDAELQDYQGRYNTIETLKKYSSPTSGIQTIYMNLYMNKTLEMANDLLKYLFNGYLELLPYVINEDEFRIPVKHGNGMISDDISSCSTAQICMISMVVTISLSLQSSGIFNIFRFDEIDGGLDTDNRLYFFDTLKRMCSELGIQQMIVISHSIESNMNGVDVIKLATPSNIEYDLSGVNVIYDYNRRWR
jgi:DNA repair exonuclease SbcCD ATPase subunit